MISNYKVDLYFPLFKDFIFTSGTKKNTNQPACKVEIILTYMYNIDMVVFFDYTKS